MCVEHHHDADEFFREVAEFRRERRNEGREVLLFVGAEAAGPVDPSHVRVVGAVEVFADTSRIYGTDHENTIIDAINLADSLIDAKLFAEARALVRDYIPAARRTLGDEQDLTLNLQSQDAYAIYRDTNSSLSDVHEAVAILADVLRTSRLVFGIRHPFVAAYRVELDRARMRLADDESRQAFTDAAPAPPTRRHRRRRRPK